MSFSDCSRWQVKANTTCCQENSRRDSTGSSSAPGAVPQTEKAHTYHVLPQHGVQRNKLQILQEIVAIQIKPSLSVHQHVQQNQRTHANKKEKRKKNKSAVGAHDQKRLNFSFGSGKVVGFGWPREYPPCTTPQTAQPRRGTPAAQTNPAALQGQSSRYSLRPPVYSNHTNNHMDKKTNPVSTCIA